ncbi:MAG: hypothetical protein P1U46_04460 [Patescibacteria group bacterium]|nr:hypothetical protein [Patescibacteria group bacterium]
MNTNPIKRKAIKKTYTKNTNYIKKKKPKNVVRIFSYIFLFFIASAFIISLFLYVKYIKDLPKVTELENLEIAESSTIYDKN